MKMYKVLFILFLFISCEPLIKEVEVINKSTASTTTLQELGTNVGIIWSNASATNLEQSRIGNWDSEEIDDPVVIKSGSTFNMWYSGRRDQTWSIGHASSGNGVSWTKSFTDNPVLYPDSNPNSLDRSGIKLSSMIFDKEENLYKMWYIGWNNEQQKIGLFFAQSPNPRKGWFKYPNFNEQTAHVPEMVMEFDYPVSSSLTNVLSKGLGKMAVLKEEHYSSGNPFYTYRFWITIIDDNNQPVIKSMVSRDEVDFDKTRFSDYGILLHNDMSAQYYYEGYMMPTLIKDVYDKKMIYKLWFIDDKSSKFGLAYSMVGGNFFSYYDFLEAGKELFGTGTIEGVDDELIRSPHVIRDVLKYRMWYVGKNEAGFYSVCYKESN